MISIQCEPLENIESEIRAIIFQHHSEVEDGDWELEPDYEEYIACSHLGLLICTTIRDCDQLVGYSIDWRFKSLHYKNKLTLVNDMLYIKPEYRHMGLMSKFFEHLHKQCIEMSVKMHSINLKVNNPCKQLMTEFGYTNQELVWMRRF